MFTGAKIFVGPREIAGFYGRLADAMRAEGFDVDFVLFKQHPFHYQANQFKPQLIRLIQFFDSGMRNCSLPIFLRYLLALGREGCRGLFFVVCLFRYRVFYFGFGDSLLWRNMDLPILRLFGKTVIACLWHGSESRPPYMDGARVSSDGRTSPKLETMCADSRSIRRRIRFFEKYADVIVGAPFTAQFFEKPFISHFQLGMPVGMTPSPEPPSSTVQFGPRPNTKTLRLLHCPSHIFAKGTEEIRETIQSLQASGLDIDYFELSGQPNHVILSALRECDLAIDQLYSDTPLATFASEAAAEGRPVIVGGYGFEYLDTLVSDEMHPASVTCLPGELSQTITNLVNDPIQRSEKGALAKAFVHSQWSPQMVAQRYLRLIEEAPSEWMLDPREIVYLEGCGQPREITIKNIRAIVESFGIRALCLDHHPSLEAYVQQVLSKPDAPFNA